MLMVIPDEGKTVALKCLLRGGFAASAEDWNVQLYKNDYTPVDDSTVGDFTAADFAGSGVFTVLQSGWIDPTIISHVAASLNDSAPAWTSSDAAPQTVYGWFAVGADSGVVRAAQRFDVPRTIYNGDTEQLNPFTVRLKTFT